MSSEAKETVTGVPPDYSGDMVRLTDGDIRFILWALPRADVSTNEGMSYYQRMSEYQWMIARLRARLPENRKPSIPHAGIAPEGET